MGAPLRQKVEGLLESLLSPSGNETTENDGVELEEAAQLAYANYAEQSAENSWAEGNREENSLAEDGLAAEEATPEKPKSFMNEDSQQNEPL